uniref:Phosphatidylinositol transfer protein membrane associated 2 n=1 Tax=Pseudonaja textilis TaxID=8673 RepID=A0A670Z057_PSETE
MLIKEYRIPLPMSVEEYRIAQLYMIQKKSREETCGEGSGVEILENRPYIDGPGGDGQYTHKVYHIGMHIPSWFRSILPKAALRVEEESWNAYPYTRTRYTCPFVEKFSIDIETYYISDSGEQPNVFNLSPAEKRQTVLDPIDIVKDPVPPHEYKPEEDPKVFKSAKTARGPLPEDWIQEQKNNPGIYPVMCAYKLCKVEFRYWGMQSKIERFIHDVGLRKVMVRAHRQAWCWQDEWYGLTIEDIRQLEKEAQLMLAKKMAQFSINEPDLEPHLPQDPLKNERNLESKAIPPSTEGVDAASNIDESLPGRVLTKQWSTSSKSSSKRGASPSHHTIADWRMQSIARDSDESTDEEFFDAHEDISENEEVFPKEITKWSSNDLMDKIETAETDEVPGSLFREQMEDEAAPPLAQPSQIHVLLLVLHGGNILDTGSGEPSSKQGDVNTIATAFDTVIRVHYPATLGRIAIKLVPCPAICSEAFSLVSNLSPYSYDEGCLCSSQDHIPLAALPLLATSSPQYQEAVATVILRANQVYSDFIRSQEGASFNGQVCLIGDCVGGILAFDALCYSNQTMTESQNSSRRGSFHILPPFNIPRYQRFPLGDGNSALLADVVQSHGGVLVENTSPSAPVSAPQFRTFRRASEVSTVSQVSGMADSYTASNIANIAAKWWGTKRIDYALYCPDALTAFPTVALPHLFHASYWESTDVVSFLLRQVMRHENGSILEVDGKEISVFTPSKPREKWLRKRTHVKLRNVTANHRINDTIANEERPQVLNGRFMYGPLDMVTLTGEKVDIHIMTQPPSGEWVYFDTEIANSSGRVSYMIPEQRRLGIGVYPVKMVVRGDHTYADSYITVLPRGTEFVVFSIDGSFAASVSIMGSDPKVRAGAVDVVRHWQELGYLIIYVTGRPDMQKQRVVAWLAQHNFPHGIVSFCDGLVHDPLRHKANFLKSLVTDLDMKIHAAYGSTKDVSVYTSINLSPSQIYIVGRPTKKLQNQCQFITEGYASHLAQLEYTHRSRPAKNTTRMALRKGSFGLPGQTEFLRKRNHLLRTISSQPTVSSGQSASYRPEWTQSHSESDRERDRERSQRSMSLATGCWGRSTLPRLEPGNLGQK